MRTIFILTLVFASYTGFSQPVIYDFRQIEYGNYIPDSINSQRTVVIVAALRIENGFLQEGDWKGLAEKAHLAFVKMRIDVIFYINHQDLLSGRFLRGIYAETLKTRGIKNVLFLTQNNDGYEIVLLPFSGDALFVTENSKAFKTRHTDFETTLYQLGREVRRAEQSNKNFLIPEKPAYLSGISIVEKRHLKHYPGQLRRSKLAVERFAKLEEPKNAGPEVTNAVQSYNASTEAKNIQLEKIIESYPYEYIIIDPMSNEDLLRNRYQFVLRNLSGAGESIRKALDYKINRGETDYVSIVPIMPKDSRTKTMHKNSIVTKFYIRQNIAKNVHVGKWDADENWQEALRHFIGNMMQSFNNVKK